MSYRIPIVKLSLIRDGSACAEKRKLTSSREAFDLCHALIGVNDREEMLALILDAKHKLTAVHTVSVGSLTLAIVHPREVFKAAILSNAAAIILAHNHPSGDPTPSEEDRTLTERLCKAGEILGIAVLDHLVIGDGRYVSFADQGWMPTSE